MNLRTVGCESEPDVEDDVRKFASKHAGAYRPKITLSYFRD